MTATAWIDAATLRRLSAVRTCRWLLAAAGDWLLIAVSIALCLRFAHWMAYAGAIIVIGTRQHALGVLMHEGVHFRVARSRFWNDRLSDWLAGYALLMPTAGYRAFHLEHHRLLDTPDDPERITVDRFPAEWAYPMARRRLAWYLLRDASGFWPRPLFILAGLIWKIPGQRLRHAVPILLLHGGAAFALTLAGLLWVYLVLWLLPLLTVFPVCFRLRTAAEHSGIEGNQTPRYSRSVVDVMATTRSTEGRTLRARLVNGIVMPHGIGYHVEHHLFPSVPFDRLPELSTRLRRQPEFAARFHVAASFLEAAQELTRASADRRRAETSSQVSAP